MRTISSTTRNNVKKLKTWMKNLIIFLLCEGDSSQESFSLIIPAVGVSSMFDVGCTITRVNVVLSGTVMFRYFITTNHTIRKNDRHTQIK